MGKPVLIDSEVLATLMTTSGVEEEVFRAAQTTARAALAAAGCDEKGEPVPLTVNGKPVYTGVDDGGRVVLIVNGHSVLAEVALALFNATPAELARLRTELDVPLTVNGKQVKIVNGAKPLSAVLELECLDDGSLVTYYDMVCALPAEFAALRKALGVPEPEQPCAQPKSSLTCHGKDIIFRPVSKDSPRTFIQANGPGVDYPVCQYDMLFASDEERGQMQSVWLNDEKEPAP